MSEETIKYRVEYDIRGVDRSIRETQRVLYFMNAVRLAAHDIQQVMRGPTLSNVLWTSVQLTRVWTHLYRLIKMTNQAQRVGVAQGIGRGVAGTLGRTLAAGQITLGGAPLGGIGGGMGAFGALGALALANPLLAGAALAAITVSAFGYRKYFMDRKMRIEREEFITIQREIAKSQGYEN